MTSRWPDFGARPARLDLVLVAVSPPQPMVRREGRVDLRVDQRRKVVVVRCKDAALAENPRCFGEDRPPFHPVERLRAGDDVGDRRFEAGVTRERLHVANVRFFGPALGDRPHLRVRLDTDNLARPIRPRPRRKAGATPEIDHPGRLRASGVPRQGVEQDSRRCRPERVVLVGETLPEIAALANCLA
jgi:hypothetical protein